MVGIPFEFDAPGWLVLLGAVPLVCLFSYRSLAALGPVRRVVAIAGRSLVLVLVIFAIADLQWKQTGDRLTVIFLFDRSLSIPEQLQPVMAEYARQEIAMHRGDSRRDLAGAIVFGGDAAVAYPPSADDISLAYDQETRVDREHTNIAAAIRLAQAAFPGDTARRIVVLTDGNANLGDTLEQARALSASGVGIDVVPIRYRRRNQVLVEKIAVPPDVRRGQPFDLRIVLNNTTPAGADEKPRTGRLKITRKTRDEERVLADEPITVAAGKRVFVRREQVEAPDFYTYQAEFIPDDAALDPITQNKRATAFTDVRGQGEVLVIEDPNDRGHLDFLADRLRHENLRVTLQSSRETFASLADLQPYDTVVLANVSRDDFTEEQLKMLAGNTEQLGAGLVMLGGPNSFGAGGWANTAIESAMPVDFQIKNAKVMPVGALALLIDRSGSMTGEKLTMAKTAAIAASEVLADTDYITVATFDFEPHLIVPIVKKGASRSIRSRINGIDADGGTNMRPGILMVHDQLMRVDDAATRHIVILTDGLTEGTNYPELIQQLRKEGITVSTVGVGPDADLKLLDELARIGGGHFYAAKSPRILPRIFQDEARVVARPLVYEHKPGFSPRVNFPHEMIRGLGDAFPPLTGYVRTRLKDSPLVEQALVNSAPETDAKYNTLLASWNYGLGKAVAFTSDAGQRWATAWTDWPGYEKFFSQVVRWSMRPNGDRGKFTLTTDLQDGRVRLIVTALDRDNDFLNFLNMSARVIGPDMQPLETTIRQIAPGRYLGEFDAKQAGSYMLMVSPGPGNPPILSGVDVPYSAEYLDREPNEEMFRELASLTPPGGKPGMLVQDSPSSDDFSPDTRSAEAEAAAEIKKWLDFNTFRHDLPKATHVFPAWHLAALAAALLFLADVFVRRVRVDVSWISPLVMAAVQKFRRRPAQSVSTPAMLRLRNTKQVVADSLDQRRIAARFEAPSVPDLSPSPEADRPLEPAAGSQAGKPAAPRIDGERPDANTYTGRLLAAKKKALAQIRDRGPKDSDGPPDSAPSN
ncbi:MAG TPA: VWA domain-containing protein [Pirellulales bacterium]|nr:VWA domain-containing protein [Pirellulales bacterium]